MSPQEELSSPAFSGLQVHYFKPDQLYQPGDQVIISPLQIADLREGEGLTEGVTYHVNNQPGVTDTESRAQIDCLVALANALQNRVTKLENRLKAMADST